MTPRPIDPEVCRLRARLPVYRRRVDQALGVIAETLARARAPYVAFSGGKDSTVLLHLVERLAPHVAAVHIDDEWYYPETEAYLAATAARLGPRWRRLRCSTRHTAWFRAWDGEELPSGPEWREGQTEFDGCFLGLRAQESGLRRVHLRAKGTLYWHGRYHCWQANPLAWWSVEDVWTYLAQHGLAVNAAYGRLAALGLPPDKQRVGPLAVATGRRAASPLTYGMLLHLKRGWPQLWTRFVARYPEAGRFA